MSRLEAAAELFERLCDLPAEQQSEELERLSGGDAALRAEVRALLDADRDPGSTLGGLGADAIRELLPSRREESGAFAIPGFRILSKLGEGGMGTVFEAEQESPRRIVALKVLRPDLHSGEVRQRFEREVQALARLRHPCIATVFETGVAKTELGALPWFAMELVRGRTLTEDADARGLDTRARLELLVAVSDAIEHAHGQGVLHRDLKPSNILVDGEGRPRVLDFGVARVTGSDLQVTTLHTSAGQVIGTLSYMSPEQASGDPEAIDERSDVYSLGVLAFELLAGELPYDVRGHSVPEALRVVVEEDATRLGTLDRSLRGDVETIVAKALEKEKERRYASAAALAGDLSRYLKNEPILARAPTRIYQVRKFARRNKGLVAGVTGAFLVLLIGTVTSTALFFRSQSNLARAEDAEAEWRAAARSAELEAALAKEVTELMVDIFRVSDPTGEAGARIPAVELLDRGREKIATRLTDQPEVRAELMAVLGVVYFGLGQYETAGPLLEETVASLRAQDDPDPLELADALFSRGEVLHYQSRLGEVRPFYEEALALRTEHLEPGDLDLAHTIDVLGRLHRDLGDQVAARGLVDRAYRMRLDAGARGLELSESLQSLASLALKRGDLEEARRLFEEALAMRLSNDDARYRVPELLGSIAGIDSWLGRPDDAERGYRECLERTREAFGEKHVFVAHSLSGLGMVLAEQHRFEEAEELLLEALAIAGNGGLGVLTQLRLADLFRDRGDLERADTAYAEVTAGYRELLGGEHPNVAVSLNNHAKLHAQRGRHEEAEELLLEALVIFDLEPGHPALSKSRAGLGRALVAQGRASAAVALGLERVAAYAAAYGEESSAWRTAAAFLADAYEQAGNAAEAVGWRGRLEQGS